MIPVSEHVSHPRPRHKVDNSSWFQIFEPFPAIPEDSVGVAHMLGPALSKLHHIPVAMKNIFLCTWHFKDKVIAFSYLGYVNRNELFRDSEKLRQQEEICTTCQVAQCIHQPVPGWYCSSHTGVLFCNKGFHQSQEMIKVLRTHPHSSLKPFRILLLNLVIH